MRLVLLFLTVAACGWCAEPIVGTWKLVNFTVGARTQTVKPGSPQDSTLVVTESNQRLKFQFSQGGKPGPVLDLPSRFDGSPARVLDGSGNELGKMAMKKLGKAGYSIESRNQTPGIVPDRIQVSGDGRELVCETTMLVPGGVNKLIQKFRKQ